MDFQLAQKDMRNSFILGAPGVLISGIIWFAAGLVATFYSFQMSIIFFFFGGMLIHPLSVVISGKMNKTYTQDKNNPLVKLALEGTILLFVGLFLAFTFSQTNPNLFYPIMLLIIGARYLTFQTIYGSKIYWVLGACLLALGMCLILVFELPYSQAAMLGGIIEVVFSVYLFKTFKQSN